jgi:hypothetical protein
MGYLKDTDEGARVALAKAFLSKNEGMAAALKWAVADLREMGWDLGESAEELDEYATEDEGTVAVLSEMDLVQALIHRIGPVFETGAGESGVATLSVISEMKKAGVRARESAEELDRSVEDLFKYLGLKKQTTDDTSHK